MEADGDEGECERDYRSEKVDDPPGSVIPRMN